MKLSLIIVNYRQTSELADCLESVFHSGNTLELEVIVVNNSPETDDLDDLTGRFPGVRLLTMPSNQGFARACNQGARQATGEFFLFLNPDTVVHPGALPVMVRYLEIHPEVGALGPRVRNLDGSVQMSCRRFPSPWTGLFNRYSLLTRWFPNNPLSRRYLMTDFDHDRIREVDWVSGCCLMTPRAAFFEVGLFDENYFLFNEDVDLCRNLHKAGYRVVYFPLAEVRHRIGSSHGKLPPWLIIKRHRGMSYYQKKHISRNRLVNVALDVMIALRCCGQLLMNTFR